MDGLNGGKFGQILEQPKSDTREATPTKLCTHAYLINLCISYLMKLSHMKFSNSNNY